MITDIYTFSFWANICRLAGSREFPRLIELCTLDSLNDVYNPNTLFVIN